MNNDIEGQGDAVPNSLERIGIFSARKLSLARLGLQARLTDMELRTWRETVSCFSVPGQKLGHPVELVRIEADYVAFGCTGCFFVYFYGATRKLLILPDLALPLEKCLQISAFVSGCIFHSRSDIARCTPDSSTYSRYDFSFALQKLFRSDQPIGLHCGHSTALLSLILLRAGFDARRLHMANAESGDGHILLEVNLGNGMGGMVVDADFGVALMSRDGEPISATNLLGMRGEGFRDVQVVDLCRKSWLPPRYNFGLEFEGGFSWSADKTTARHTADPEAYRNMLLRYCQRMELRAYTVDGDKIAVGPVT
ncbi:hypothetical protein [Reyranella sp.]|uniref:hypothetical protein n=1 Tax=Reyranella sp. TaxID=1929291 RepID=UPI003782F5F1